MITEWLPQEVESSFQIHGQTKQLFTAEKCGSGLTSSCQMFQTLVGSPPGGRCPSPHPWEPPWWGEAVCSVCFSSWQQQQQQQVKKSLTRTRKDFQSKLGSLSFKYSQRTQKPWGGTCRGETRPWAWRRASRQEFPSNESRGQLEDLIWSERLDHHPGPHTLWYLHEVAVEERSLGQDEVGRDAAGDRLLDGHQLLLGLLNARIQTLEVAPAQEMRDWLTSCNLNTYRL